MHSDYTIKGMHTNKTSIQLWKHIQITAFLVPWSRDFNSWSWMKNAGIYILFFFSFFLINNAFHQGNTKSASFSIINLKSCLSSYIPPTVKKKKKKE